MADVRFKRLKISGVGEDAWLDSGKAAVGLATTVMIMVLFGLAMLYSTSSGMAGAKLFIKQLVWAILGIFFATSIYYYGYKRVLAFTGYFLAGCALLLIIARLGKPINGAYRWIQLGGISVQPSEFAKLAVIMFLAQFCTSKQHSLSSFKHGLLPCGIVCCAMAGLILLGKDLGTTFLLVATILFVLFAAGLRLRWYLLLFSFCILLAPICAEYLKSHDPERWSRVTSFTDPKKYAKDEGYQLWNSLMALGSGNWTGLGFTKSRMKGMYLPEAHTDFILSIVGEELGYAAMLAVIFLYFMFMVFAIYISIRSPDRQGMLLGFGICALITMQSIINIGVISGMLPTKGIPAPFISYGGSNLMACLCAVGLLLSISNQENSGEIKHTVIRPPFQPPPA